MLDLRTVLDPAEDLLYTVINYVRRFKTDKESIARNSTRFYMSAYTVAMGHRRVPYNLLAWNRSLLRSAYNIQCI